MFETLREFALARLRAHDEEASATEPLRAEWTGTHRLNGVLAARGAGIRAGERLDGARIIDIAPTILHLLGQAVPDDMDGQVLTDWFDENHAGRGPVSYRHTGTAAAGPEEDTYSEEETEIIQKRLQDLGYVE